MALSALGTGRAAPPGVHTGRAKECTMQPSTVTPSEAESRADLPVATAAMVGPEAATGVAIAHWHRPGRPNLRAGSRVRTSAWTCSGLFEDIVAETHI